MTKISVHHNSPASLTPLKKAAYSIATKLAHAGFLVLYAGGWVRDLIMGKEGDDIDIATDATPEEIIKLFPKAIPVGISFGVVRIIQDSFQFEVATFRTDGTYEDGRHPTSIHLVRNPLEDAQRRDFTVNGLFYNPLTQEIIDYVNGIADIKKKCIRTIGSPLDRFSEDKLRIIRAIRFKNALGFTIEPSTWEAICHFASETVQALSQERIWQEFEKMKKKKVLLQSLYDLLKAGLFPFLFPAFKDESSHESQNRIDKLSSVQEEVFNTALIIGALFDPNEDAAGRENLALQYKLSNNDIKALSTLSAVERALQSPSELSELEWVKIYAYPFAEDALTLIGQYNQGALRKEINFHLTRRQELSFWVNQLVTKQMFIGGKELLSYGVEKGKKMGEMIERAFIHSLETRCLDQDKIINAILE